MCQVFWFFKGFVSLLPMTVTMAHSEGVGRAACGVNWQPMPGRLLTECLLQV